MTFHMGVARKKQQGVFVPRVQGQIQFPVRVNGQVAPTISE